MTYILYGLVAVFLAISAYKDLTKTKKALKKAYKSFMNILPQILSILTLVGLLLAWVQPSLILRLIGEESGFLGVFLAATIGGITLIPGFISFPLAAMLLESGAGYIQIGAFISTLMMVGFMTMPMEIKYFGKKGTFIRNGAAYMFAFVVALWIGWVMHI